MNPIALIGFPKLLKTLDFSLLLTVLFLYSYSPSYLVFLPSARSIIYVLLVAHDLIQAEADGKCQTPVHMSPEWRKAEPGNQKLHCKQEEWVAEIVTSNNQVETSFNSGLLHSSLTTCL